MALKQRHGAAEIEINDTKIGRNYDSNSEKRKDNGEILTAILLPPQDAKQQVLKFVLGT